EHPRHRLHAVGRHCRAAAAGRRRARGSARRQGLAHRGHPPLGRAERGQGPRARPSLPRLVGNAGRRGRGGAGALRPLRKGAGLMELLYALPLLVKAAILGVVEGLTEFLPISSTGHLILTASLLGFAGEKEKMVNVAIQTGAMFAVMWYYRQRILDTITGIFTERRAQRFAANVLIAFLPAAILGLAFGGWIKDWLFRPVPVAIAFI